MASTERLATAASQRGCSARCIERRDAGLIQAAMHVDAELSRFLSKRENVLSGGGGAPVAPGVLLYAVVLFEFTPILHGRITNALKFFSKRKLLEAHLESFQLKLRILHLQRHRLTGQRGGAHAAADLCDGQNCRHMHPYH